MICPNCSTDNPTAARFCLNCGAALTIRCSNCQAELPAQARFCMNCGQPVTVAPTDDARLTRLASATPVPLADKMRAAHLAGERKVVTALFVDVVGSTALATHLDPEDWAAVMNRAFDRFYPAIYHYEGTIARLLGDALLAFFGAPVTHEDDAVRAVRAALDLLSATREYAEEVRREYGVDFAVRVGLNTGLVIVGEVGSDLKYEYTAMGDAINLAERMQAAARPMTVLISENTFRFVAPVFDCTDLGLIEVKGKTEPVRSYQVHGPKTTPGKLRGLAGLESPMVGRDAELAALRQLGVALQAGATAGGVALIVGEPGLGKTRLISEWKMALASLISNTQCPLKWAEGHCLSYGQGLAYHLLLDLLRSLIGVQATASEHETRAALLQMMDDLGAGDSMVEVYPYLGHLLSLQLDGEALERVRVLDPQALQVRYLAALRQLFRAQAARGPLVLILEDVHWADPSSIELLIKLLPLAAEAPLLFCFVARPDQDAPGWKLILAARETLGVALTDLTLVPLSEADSRQLVSNLLVIESLPLATRALILQKAEGNPFFVEELIRMLIDRGAIVKKGAHWVAVKEIENVEIPDNLQGLLLARIDRLPEDVKRTLRVASVIGRRFSVKVLEQVLEKG
jgi:class 3 adenylate cyclase